jgi:hypothetical protein
MTLRAAVAVALLALAAPAAAQFEGVADLKMTGSENGQKMEGKGKLFVTSSAWRMEMEMAVPDAQGRGKKAGAPAPGQEFRMVMFGKLASPGKSWMLNDKTKTYAVVEDSDDDEGPAGHHAEQDDWSVTKLGEDRVAGFSCTKVKAQRKGEDQIWEACLARDFVSAAWLKSMKMERNEGEWWHVAAQRAGVTGYPVRLVARAKDGTERHRMEIVSVDRRRLPGSLFEVPAGYRETSVMANMAQNPEQQAQMQEAQRQAAEAMKKMSPEDRKKMEEMMKRFGAGQKQ